MSSESFGGGRSLLVDRDSCFSDAKGRAKESLERKQRKLLEKIAPLMGTILEEGEEIRYVAQGVSPFGVMELLTTGWVLQLIKRCLLVITDRRLLHLPAKLDYSPKSSVAEVRFGDLQAWKVSSFPRRLRLTYRNGKKEDFTAVPGLSVAKLRVLLPQPPQGDSTPEGSRRHLCPSCAQPLEQGQSRCSRCGLEFKNWAKAMKLSLLVPGGGYFYTGHLWMGAVDFVVEAALLLLVVLGLVDVFSGEEGGLAVLLVAAALLGLEKLLTLYHAKHYLTEFLPADASFTPARR